MSDDVPRPESPRFSRRRLLTGAAVLGGATAASVALPPNLRKAMAAPLPKSFSLKEIKHVVLVMQENRSFDHYFGTMPGVRGFADPTAIKLPDGRSVFYQPYSSNPLGYLLPFHVDTLNTGAQAIPDTDHSWQTQHQAWDSGAMDEWLPAKGPWTMAYYEQQDIPFHWALAENFTILDHYHCSVLGPTTPNRMMWMTGTIDPNGGSGGPLLETVTSGDFNWPTYAEALTEAGVSWKFYNDALGNPYMNVLPYFQNFQNAEPGSVLYDSGVAAAATGQFEYDCLTGNLPTVTWLGSPEQYWEHPSDTPAYGAQWLSAKIDAIASNRELWESTVFILNYDENDGLFDHVVPPTPPAGTPDEFPTVVDPVSGLNGIGQPIGMGFRVPCIIVSPWTQGGFVCSDVSDHTSILQFLEVVTGVPCTQISAWRRQTASDLTGAFAGPGYNPSLPMLPDTNGQVWLTNYTTTLPLPGIPTTNQTFPIQPPGRRPHTR